MPVLTLAICLTVAGDPDMARASPPEGKARVPASANNWVEDKDKGWFFYNEEEEEPVRKKASPPPPPPKECAINLSCSTIVCVLWQVHE